MLSLSQASSHPLPSVALAMVRSRAWVLRVGFILLLLVGVVVVGLWRIPWQQSIVGMGEVIIFNPMDRPQSVEAQIPGRLVKWYVQEGQQVKKGDPLALLEDLDSKFLDPEQPKRLEQQRQMLIARRTSAESRATSLQSLINAQQDSRVVAVPSAQERAKQTRDRLNAAKQSVVSAEQSLKAARDVSKQAARERQRQAEERVQIAEQAMEATKENARITSLNLERVTNLEKKGLRSKRDLELTQNEQIRATTELRRAENNLEIAKRDTNVTSLEQTRADLEVVRAQSELARTQATLDAAQRDTRVGDLDAGKVEADTRGTISNAQASLASAQETIASIGNDIIKIEIDLQNLRRRTKQQEVLSPSTGRVVRLVRVGTGETVKAGDVLAVLAPNTTQYLVELYVSDNDAPFVFEGAPVRLQFAGWPALQFVGFPSVAVGTFAGKVKLVDAIDDGKNRYRLVVEQDTEAIKSGKEQPWPLPNSLKPNEALTIRPGAEVHGWVMLREVSLGFEMWRQLNAFPPTVSSKFIKNFSFR